MRQLFKGVLAAGFGNLVNILLGVVMTKIVAVTAGPAGIALFAQLRQVGQWQTILASVNGAPSVVRGVGARAAGEQRRFVLAALAANLAGTLLVASLVWLGAPYIAPLLFGAADAALVDAVRYTTILLLFGVTASLVVAVTNGLGAIRALLLMQFSGALASAALAWPLAMWHAPLAYILLAATPPFATTIAGLVWLRRQGYLAGGRVDWTGLLQDMRDFFGIAIPYLAAGLVNSAVLILLRGLYMDRGGLPLGGLFESAWLISATYTGLPLNAFGTYWTPVLSNTVQTGPAETRRHVLQAFKLMTLLSIPLVTLVVVGKPIVIRLLYSAEFTDAIGILRWLLIADYFRLTSWVFALMLIVFKERRKFVITEVGGWLVLLGASYLFIDRTHDIVGIAALCWFAGHFAYVYRNAVRVHGIRIPPLWIGLWALGLVTVIGFSFITWDISAINDALPWLLAWLPVGLAALGMLIMVLRRAES